MSYLSKIRQSTERDRIARPGARDRPHSLNGPIGDSSETLSSRHVPPLLPPGSLEVALEQPVEEEPRELGVVVDLLVELEVGVDQLLDLVVGDVVEGQAGVLGDV